VGIAALQNAKFVVGFQFDKDLFVFIDICFVSFAELDFLGGKGLWSQN
jgi:hypothetical protein